MKKYLFLCLIALCFSACSDDDAGSSVIKKIKQTNYQGTGGDAIQYIRFTDGKISSVTNYSSDNFLRSTVKYSYYSNGLVSKELKESAGGNTIFNKTFNYDSQGRMMYMKHLTSEGDYYINYVFHNDNTVTAQRLGANPGTKTYYLNSDGLIYKEVGEDFTYEVVFDGPNPVSGSRGMFTNTFEYDNEHDPSLRGMVNPMGSYGSNQVLMNNSLLGNETGSATKYVTKASTFNNGVTTYEYTFNGDGRPTRRKDYKDGVLVSELEYNY